MKKIYSILLTIAAAAFMVVSCQEEQAYEPGPQDMEGCYGVYFPAQEATGAHTYDPTMPTVQEFTVARKVSDDAIDVPYEINDPKGIFKCGPIHFDAGQTETTFEVEFPDAEMGVEYPLTIVITDNQYASFYGDCAIAFDFSAFRVEWKYFLNPAGEKAKLTFYETFWDEVHTGYIKYYEVDGVRTCITESDPTADGAYGFWGTGEKEGDGEFSFTWYTNVKCYGADGETTYQAIHVPEQKIWYHTSYLADVNFYDWYGYFTIVNPQAALAGMDFPTFCSKYSGSYPCSYYDGNGGFYFFAAYYYMIGIGGWGIEDYDPYCIADGFTRTDYSIEAETDYTVDGEVPVYFTTGVDAAAIKYVALDGELTATQVANVVAAITDGSQEGLETITEFEYDEEENVNYASVALSFEKSGYYTVVAMTFDAADAPKESTSVVVNYISPEDEEACAVDVHIGVEAVPARYEADPYTTMAYYVVGKNLTDVHMSIVPSSKLTQATLNAIKYDSSYAVDEETLAQINAQGGIYDYATGLSANTQYYLVVWATNGNLDTLIGAAYTTPKLPYVWNSLGTGYYTDDTLSYLYGYDPVTVPVEVYQEASETNLIMFKGHALELAADAFEVSTSVIEPYEGTYWRDAEIVLDVKNASSVVWELQDYGVCLSSSDGFMNLIGNMYQGQPFSKGIYADGAISYPTAKGMLCGFENESGSLYYANGTGSTKLVLPEASKPAMASPAKVNGNMDKSFRMTPEYAMPEAKIAIERDITVASCTSKTIAHQEGQKSSKNDNITVARENIAF